MPQNLHFSAQAIPHGMLKWKYVSSILQIFVRDDLALSLITPQNRARELIVFELVKSALSLFVYIYIYIYIP